MCDQLRRDVLGCMGHSVCKTPHLDRLATQSVVFDQACSVAPICSPARASTFTGLYPNATGVYFNNHDLPQDQLSLAEILHGEGYTTHLYGKWHLGRHQPGSGWDKFLDSAEHHEWLKERGYQRDDRNAATRMHFSPGKVKRETSPIAAEDYFDSWLVDRALEGLEDLAGSSKPFFLNLSLHAPHPPFSVPTPYSTLYDPSHIELPASAQSDYAGKPKQIFTEWGWKHGNHFTDDDWRDMIAHYWGLVTYVDDQIGRFLHGFERSGLADETLLIFTSDHGDMTGSFRMFGKHNFAYEEVMRVPQMVRLPGVTPRRSEAPVSLVDITPTILDYAGIAPPYPMHGESMLGILDSDASWSRDANFSSCNLFEHFFLLQKEWKISPGMVAEIDTFKAVRTRRWKYIVHRYGSFEELYDLENDPGELHNLLQTEPDKYAAIHAEMKARLLQHLFDAQDLHADCLGI